MPMAWRRRLRPLSGPDLLAAIATVALLAGVGLALAASGVSLPGDIPLWDAALAVCVLAVLASLLCFPEWWSWAGGWGTKRRACSADRRRRVSQTAMPCQARTRRRPDLPGAHRTAPRMTGGPLAGGRHRSRAAWLLAARRRDSIPRLQRQHGRLRD
jgi:hypothetical protein